MDGQRQDGQRQDVRARRRTLALLAGHVPLSLLMDLAGPDGPPSSELLLHEDHPMAGWRQESPSSAPR